MFIQCSKLKQAYRGVEQAENPEPTCGLTKRNLLKRMTYGAEGMQNKRFERKSNVVKFPNYHCTLEGTRRVRILSSFILADNATMTFY